MNAVKHAEISVFHHGGEVADYFPVHFFIDSTKELCSDNRHRILHTLWGVRRVVMPLFGHSLTNSDGKAVNVKDLCEKDHILPDYRNRFIPTLGDFCAAIDEERLPANYKTKINDLHALYTSDRQVSELLLSPLALTGQFKSLLITHNSWFISEILPKILPAVPVRLQSFSIAPGDLFSAMRFEPWMDNGAGLPPSAAVLHHKI